ncbi:MAG: flotillin family protein [Myxococcales bacterium]|nr:flotillin family protein [Myxococcales bacterium]
MIGIGAMVLAGVLVVFVLLFFAIIKNLLYICPPNEVMIFSGGGGERGYRMIFGGRGWRKPFVEKVDFMSLNTMEIPLRIRNAYSHGGIPLDVDAVANVKISSDPRLIGNALERFLGRDPNEIRRVAKESLEGHLRGVLATLTPEEVNEDRLKFSQQMADETEADLNLLGIHLDTFKIQHVADERNYLNSIGRQAIANVIKNAEMAESDAHRDAEQAEAENAGRANVTVANVEAEIARMNNDLRRIRADLEANVKAEEARTQMAAQETRALAEQKLQQVRAELESIRLNTDAVLPAEAARQAQEFAARGDAAAILERGRAVGKALDMLNAAWADAGEQAMGIYVIEGLEKILGQMAEGIERVKIQSLSLIDSGDGQTLSSYVAAYPAMLSVIFDAVTKTTGIDIPRIVAGDAAAAGGAR